MGSENRSFRFVDADAVHPAGMAGAKRSRPRPKELPVLSGIPGHVDCNGNVYRQRPSEKHSAGAYPEKTAQDARYCCSTPASPHALSHRLQQPYSAIAQGHPHPHDGFRPQNYQHSYDGRSQNRMQDSGFKMQPPQPPKRMSNLTMVTPVSAKSCPQLTSTISQPLYTAPAAPAYLEGRRTQFLNNKEEKMDVRVHKNFCTYWIDHAVQRFDSQIFRTEQIINTPMTGDDLVKSYLLKVKKTIAETLRRVFEVLDKYSVSSLDSESCVRVRSIMLALPKQWRALSEDQDPAAQVEARRILHFSRGARQQLCCIRQMFFQSTSGPAKDHVSSSPRMPSHSPIVRIHSEGSAGHVVGPQQQQQQQQPRDNNSSPRLGLQRLPQAGGPLRSAQRRPHTALPFHSGFSLELPPIRSKLPPEAFGESPNAACSPRPK